MRLSQSWFEPFSSFGVWDEIIWAEPAGSWAGNAAGGGLLGPLDPCSPSGCAADPRGRAAAAKHSPVPSVDLTEASGDWGNFHPRRVL